MCGIFGGYVKREQAERGLTALAHRGPDGRGLDQVGDLWLGHHRLAILDLDPRSDQPFRRGRVVLSYNGELWNYRQLRVELEALGQTFTTTGDTEVVAAALDIWGTAVLPRFNGMFALAWTDDGGQTVRLARDRFGEVPLHLARQQPFCFASELKGLLAAGADPRSFEFVPPGAVVTASPVGLRVEQYHNQAYDPAPIGFDEAAAGVRARLEASCAERVISDVPICTLLSGGLDSSAVALLLAKHLPDLVAYTAVMDPKARDLRCARQVAGFLGIELVEVVVPEPTPADLARTVQVIELPHKAQVEIGWACLKLAEALRSDGHEVVFSGEGSDELWGSYGFSYHGIKQKGWHAYRRDLFLDQHRKNFARCNKVFMASGVECRLPFLNPGLVGYILSLTEDAVRDGSRRPKAVLEEAFRADLPGEILARAKVAFQDGMGLKQAVARTVPNPGRYYRVEYERTYG